MSKKTQDRAVRNARRTVETRDRAEASTNVVDATPVAVVNSVSPSETPIERKTLMLTRINKNRKGSNVVYSFGAGSTGTVKFAKSLLGDNPPDTLPDAVSEWPIQKRTPKAKMTKEERAAARAAETPAMKLAKAQERAKKAAERAAKLEAALAAPVA